MSPRAGGFVAMFATALLLLATLAPIPIAGQTNAWWSGHPSVDGGKPIEAKEVTISLFTSKGCNTGGDGECQPVPLGGGFRGVRYTEMGLVSLLALFTLLLGIASVRVRRSRASFAKVVMVAAMISAIGSIVLLVMGTDIRSSKPVAVPMGPGLILFFIGTAMAIGAAVVALLPYHEPLPRTLPPMPMPMPMPSQPAPQPGFDVEAMFAHDAPRPAVPDLMMGRPQSPGGALPGPGPLMPQSGAQPLFQSAPNLRPLYEANGDFAPTAQPVQFPTRPPTPIGHAAVNAALGLDTPPKGIPVAGSPVIPLPPIQAPKLPPPSRTKPLTAPPLPPLAKRPPPPTMRPPPPTTKPPPLKLPSASPTMMSAVVPMPPSRPSVDEMVKTADFEKALATGDSTDNLDVELLEASDSAAKPIDMPFDTSTAENSTSAFEREDKGLPFDTSTAETSSKAFQSDENTDVGGGAVDDLETAAREKLEPESPPRPSATAVELATRNSGTEVELEAARASTTSVISSAAPPAKPTISTAPESLPPPPEGAPSSGPSPACPQCEAPMAWVEEHLRFFCKSCRMYF
jgi:hypothetical protein